MSSNEPTHQNDGRRVNSSHSDLDDRLSSNDDSNPTLNSPSFFAYNTEERCGLEPGSSKIYDSKNLPLNFANHTLIKKLGEGGAGIVFLAEPQPQNPLFGLFESVALKMIRPEIVSSVRAVKRFEKESRLHAEIDSQFVTRHLGFGADNGSYYIVSEFAQGISLDRVVDQLAELPAKMSLRIIVDVLEALAVMHSAGLIHRDVKPANIIANFQDLNASEDEIEFGEFLIAKLTDFGLARHIEQSESLAMTKQQTMLGTPLYMAPEQHYESRAVDARADIYSVGVTLYQLLAGYPPFDTEETVEMAEMHRFERPLPLTIARPGTSEGINNLVMKALEKDPNLRYQHAQEMLADVQRLLADQPLSLRMYPETPDAFHPAVKCYNFQWELEAEAKQLWPLVSDTDRFNKAMGLPAPKFSYDNSGEQLKVFADVKFKGMKVRWQEHPFQWILGREMSVLREFELGPFEWVTSTVEILPMAGQRTRLIHRFQVKPRGLFGKFFTQLQFGVLTKRSLKKVYRRLEEIANDESCGFACDVPFGTSPKFSPAQLNYLEQKIGRLGKEIGNVQLAKKFGEFIQRVADPTAARIRPFEIATKLDCTKDQSLQICFEGVSAGLLNLSWDIICPVCRIAADNVGSLERIASHAHCKVCNIQFEASFSKSVEAIFGVHPEIREVELKTYCIGGPYHAPHVLAQNRLLANQHVDVGVVLNEGKYEITGPQLAEQRVVEVDEDAVSSRAEFIIGGESPRELPKVCSGQACLVIDNKSDVEVLVRLEQASKQNDSLTAAVASQHPLFRQMFPAEVTTVEQLVGLSSVYLLAIRYTMADELLDQVGDIEVRENWNRWQQQFPTDERRCKIIECTHELLIASFDLIDDLLETFLNLLKVGEDQTVIPLRECCFVINSGEVMTGVSANQPSTFGKTIRDTKKNLTESSVGELRVPNETYRLVRQSHVWSKEVQTELADTKNLSRRFSEPDGTSGPLVLLSLRKF